MEIKDFTDHKPKPKYVLPGYLDIPMYTTNVHDGYYTSSGIAIKESGNKVYVHKSSPRSIDPLTMQKQQRGILKQFTVEIPQGHKILHVSVGAEPEIAIFHTDGRSLYVTKSSSSTSHREIKLLSPPELRVFNTTLAMKQRTGSWIFISPQLMAFTASKLWVDFDSPTKVRDVLRERSLTLKKEYGDPIFARVSRYMSTTSKTGPTALIITDKHKLIIAHFGNLHVHDLGEFFGGATGDELKKGFESVKDIRVAMNMAGHVAFQFDNGPIFAFHDNTPDKKYKLTKVDDKGRLVDNDSKILAQDGSKLFFPTSGEELDLTVDRPIVAITQTTHGFNDFIVADNEGGFYQATKKGKQPDPELFKDFKADMKNLFYQPSPAYIDTFRQLVHDLSNVLESFKMCE